MKDPFYWIVLIGLLLIFGIVGTIDYDAAVVTDQITRQGASNPR